MVAFSGWLEKEGHVVRNWKKRFFVLEGNTLRYFDTSSWSHSSPKGSFELLGSKVRRYSQRDGTTDWFCIRVDTFEGVDYPLRTTSEEARDLWIDHINTVRREATFNGFRS
jgi:hypothetical protein